MRTFEKTGGCKRVRALQSCQSKRAGLSSGRDLLPPGRFGPERFMLYYWLKENYKNGRFCPFWHDQAITIYWKWSSMTFPLPPSPVDF